MNSPRLSHFHGGLVLRHHKKMSCDEPMLDAGIPEKLILSISNKGIESELLVGIGDSVLKGQILAKPNHPLGVYVHAPTSGIIEEVIKNETTAPNAKVEKCLVLKTDGLNQSISTITESKLPNNPAEIIKKIHRAGIIGMGGAGFPTHAKYTTESKDLTLVINGAECEPYISCDERLMLDYPAEIIKGTSWLLKACNASKAIIAIEDNIGGVKKQLDAELNKQNINHISVVKVPTIYPTGGEKQLIKVLSGQEVPSGSTPLSVGYIMQNVATAKAVFDAIEQQQPLISRVVTVTGDAIENPRNFETLIGTPIQHLLNLVGLKSDDLDKLIIGGPMMGYAMPHTNIGIEKSSNCVLALPPECTKPEIEALPCIRCGDCVKACPQELLPQQLLWYINGNDDKNDLEKARDHHVFDCIECGACSWVCPSHINLVDFYRFAKSELVYLDHKKAKAEKAKNRHEFRESRLEQIKAERQAKRRNKTSQLSDKKSAKAEISAVLQRIKQQEKAKSNE